MAVLRKYFYSIIPCFWEFLSGGNTNYDISRMANARRFFVLCFLVFFRDMSVSTNLLFHSFMRTKCLTKCLEGKKGSLLSWFWKQIKCIVFWLLTPVNRLKLLFNWHWIDKYSIVLLSLHFAIANNYFKILEKNNVL